MSHTRCSFEKKIFCVLEKAGDDVKDFIGDEVKKAAQLWIQIRAETFHQFENKLCQLDPENDSSHEEYMDWEDEERKRIDEMAEEIDDRLAEESDYEWDLDEIESVLRDVIEVEDIGRIRLPDLPWNEYREFKFEQMTVELMGDILNRARNEGRELVATTIVNRNSCERHPDGPSQSAINGDPNWTATWLHNFVCCYIVLCHSHVLLWTLGRCIHHAEETNEISNYDCSGD